MPSNCPPLVGCGPGPWFVQHLWPIPCSECAVPSAFRTIQVLWAAVNKSSGQNSIAKMPNRKQGTCTEEQNSSPVWWSGQSSCKPGTVNWIWSLVCVRGRGVNILRMARPGRHIVSSQQVTLVCDLHGCHKAVRFVLQAIKECATATYIVPTNTAGLVTLHWQHLFTIVHVDEINTFHEHLREQTCTVY